MIFGTWNPEKIWYQKLINLPTSPVSWSHSTFFHDFTHQKSLKLVNCWQLFKNKKAARFFRTQCRPRSFCSTVNVPTYREAHHLYLGHWVIITLSVARSLRHWASCFTHTHTHTHTYKGTNADVCRWQNAVDCFVWPWVNDDGGECTGDPRPRHWQSPAWSAYDCPTERREGAGFVPWRILPVVEPFHSIDEPGAAPAFLNANYFNPVWVRSIVSSVYICFVVIKTLI